MPLDREHITVASRIMLPIYVIFFAVVGLNYLLTPHVRLIATPSLEFSDHIIPLHGWGAIFLVSAILMLTAMIRRLRGRYRYALWVCILSMGLFTVAGMFAPFFTDASPASWIYPGFVAIACFATERSLNAGEV